ncbi:sulfotransferase [Chloroflexota bacterium]|nr:sulfotransferase [Chloroflexota bacterium]
MIFGREPTPIFICGHPKAGTSLLTSLLDGHPEMVVYPEETLFFRRFLPAIGGKSISEKLALADELLIHIFQWNQEEPPEHQKDYPDRDYSDIDFDKVHQTLAELIPSGEASDKVFLEAALQAFGQVSGSLITETHYWVEKTPYNEFYADKIFEWWPGAKCVHVIRDPRDNFISYKLKQPDWNAKIFAWNWVRSTRAGLANQAKYGGDRYFLIQFEELLRNPEYETRRLAEFLGLDWDESLLQPTRVGDSWRGNSMFDDKFQAISMDPIDRWKDLISTFDLAIVQAIADRAMTAVGYELAEIPMGDLSIQEKVRVLRERAVARLKNAL